MNLGFVVRRAVRIGGTEGYVLNLLRYLAERGHSVTLYAGEVDPDAVAASVRVVRLPGGRGGRRGLLRFAVAARRAELAGHDVVQGFGRSVHHDIFRAGGGCHRTWLRLRGGVSTPWDQLEAALDTAALRRAQVVICNSEMAARDVVVDGGVAPMRVRVVRNGVDLERFAPSEERRAAVRAELAVPEGGRVALFLGSGFERKGLHVAAKAFARVAGSSDRFVVVGADRREERARNALLAELGDRLVWVGPSSTPEHWLAAADASVLPTRYDPAANTTLESLACGVPVVTTQRDGNHEVVPDAAWVVADPSDVPAVSRALHAAWLGGAEQSCREAAVCWPVSRNGREMEQIYGQWIDGELDD